MQRAAARAQRATKPIRALSDWTHADDDTLVAGLLARNEYAQLEFLDRFEVLIEERIATTIRRCNEALCTPKRIEKIAASAESLVTDNRDRLRAFNSRRGTLAEWVGRVAERAALVHLDDLTHPEEELSQP
jgi:hypothetical protein